MTETLTPADSLTTVNVPVAGEPRTAASIKGPFQAIYNRAHYALQRVLALAPYGDGVAKVRRVANLTALKAVAAASRADGEVIAVTGYGLYFYDASSTATVDEPWIVKPDDVSTGRWTSSLGTLKGLNNGLATLDSTGKLASLQRRNQVIGIGRAELSSAFSTTSTTYVQITDLTVSMPNVEVGDYFLAVARLHGESTNGEDYWATLMRPTDLLGEYQAAFADTFGGALARSYVAPSTGSKEFQVWVKLSVTGGTLTVLGEVIVFHMRP